MAESDLLHPVPWETRNLGIESFEVTAAHFERGDEAALDRALREKIETHGRIFAQARAGKDHLAAIAGLEGLGFRAIEMILEPHTPLASNTALAQFISDRQAFLPRDQRIADWCVDILDRGDSARCDRVRAIAAESFSNDRFHLDPRCDEETANRRFALWADDLLADERVTVHLMSTAGQAEAFLARRGDNMILVGFSRRQMGKGLAKFFWLSVLEQMAAEGLPQMRTVISVNNLPVLNLHARLGFKFRHPATTLHLWSD